MAKPMWHELIRSALGPTVAHLLNSYYHSKEIVTSTSHDFKP